jgi:hypothetical protein
MANIYQVDPWLVDLGNYVPSGRDVRNQIDRLVNEGQIEPIEVRLYANGPAVRKYTLDPDGWFYAGAQIAAARELRWPTILVTY